MFPGPTILSTGRSVGVPQAIAAIAGIPPSRQTSPTPTAWAAASSSGATLPSRRDGVHSTVCGTPATTAGTRFMMTDENSGSEPAVPPGT